eukprot:jgi/Mesvir1/1579/Mv14548-RA.1
MAYEKELAVARRAALLAARLTRLVQSGLKSEEKMDKQDDSPVTVADYGAQAVVSWVLQQSYPGERVSLVAEEDSADLQTEGGQGLLQRVVQVVNYALRDAGPKGEPVTLSPREVVEAIDQGGSQGGPTGRHWVLDPIDGTRGFVRGDQYAIALGLLDNGEAVAGVLGCPNLPLTRLTNEGLTEGQPRGCLFSASKGDGCFLEAMDGDQASVRKRVHMDDLADPVWCTMCESYESRHSNHEISSRATAILGVVTPSLRADSQAKYGAMARGDAHIYMRFPPPTYREKIWDHCAGAIVITEAGGVVMDARGAPLDFSKGRYLDIHKGIIATTGRLKDVVLAAVELAISGYEAEEKAKK